MVGQWVALFPTTTMYLPPKSAFLEESLRNYANGIYLRCVCNIDIRNRPMYLHRQQLMESFPWGDRCRTGVEVNNEDMFRLLSHNVNGLSMSRDQSELCNFADALGDKSVSLFGLQETNRNVGKRHVLESFHHTVRSVSTHHHGAVSSARLEWDHDYQPGGTAISVRNKWATRQRIRRLWQMVLDHTGRQGHNEDYIYFGV